MLQDVLSFKQLYRGKCPKKVINPNSIISANDSDWKFLIVSSAVYPREMTGVARYRLLLA